MSGHNFDNGTLYKELDVRVVGIRSSSLIIYSIQYLQGIIKYIQPQNQSVQHTTEASSNVCPSALHQPLNSQFTLGYFSRLQKATRLKLLLPLG